MKEKTVITLSCIVAFVAVVTLIVLLSASKVRAASFDEALSAKAEPVVTISSTILTKYVDDNGTHYGNGAVVQSALEISLPKGFYVEVWNSTSLTRNPEGRENDMTLGWGGEVGPVEIEIGGTYIDIEKMIKADESDLWLIFGIAKKEFQISDKQKLIPFLKGQFYLPVKGSSVGKKGFQLIVGLEHELSLSKLVALSNKLSFMYDDGAVGYQRAGIIDFAPEFKIKASEYISFVVNGRVVAPMTKVSDGRRTEVIGGVGVVFSF